MPLEGLSRTRRRCRSPAQTDHWSGPKTSGYLVQTPSPKITAIKMASVIAFAPAISLKLHFYPGFIFPVSAMAINKYFETSKLYLPPPRQQEEQHILQFDLLCLPLHCCCCRQRSFRVLITDTNGVCWISLQVFFNIYLVSHLKTLHVQTNRAEKKNITQKTGCEFLILFDF